MVTRDNLLRHGDKVAREWLQSLHVSEDRSNPSLQSLCERAGLDGSGTKAELIDRLLESEGKVSEPEPEPAEPTEPES